MLKARNVYAARIRGGRPAFGFAEITTTEGAPSLRTLQEPALRAVKGWAPRTHKSGRSRKRYCLWRRLRDELQQTKNQRFRQQRAVLAKLQGRAPTPYGTVSKIKKLGPPAPGPEQRSRVSPRKDASQQVKQGSNELLAETNGPNTTSELLIFNLHPRTFAPSDVLRFPPSGLFPILHSEKREINELPTHDEISAPDRDDVTLYV